MKCVNLAGTHLFAYQPLSMVGNGLSWMASSDTIGSLTISLRIGWHFQNASFPARDVRHCIRMSGNSLRYACFFPEYPATIGGFSKPIEVIRLEEALLSADPVVENDSLRVVVTKTAALGKGKNEGAIDEIGDG